MGNCQAIDAATLVVQHPSGKVDKLYWPVPASEIMKMNPGHYVALLITTTICHSSSSKSDTPPNNSTQNPKSSTKNNTPTNNSDQKSSSNTRNNSPKSSSDNSKGSERKNNSNSNSSSSSNGAPPARNSVRITRVKLLRPTDTLALGHVYRLISTQEVMKGLVAKKQAKMRKNGIELADSEALKEAEKLARRSQVEKSQQVSRHGHRSRTAPSPNGGTARPKSWQPSLHSISEASS